MSDVDNDLLDLISTLTDECTVLGLKMHVVDHYGRERAARVVRDGFAGVVHIEDGEDNFEVLQAKRFLPWEEALRVIGLKRISWRYEIAQLPGAVGFEDDPHLIFRYAADDPDAIAAVRAQHGVD
jgi:hypothetical protein